MNLYEKAKNCFNKSKLGVLLKRKIEIENTIKIKRSNIFFLELILDLFLITGNVICFFYPLMGIEKVGFIVLSMAAMLSAITVSLSTVLRLKIQNKINEYYEKKYGLIYIQEEIKNALLIESNQKILFEYIDLFNEKYQNGKIKNQTDKLKILFLEKKEQEIIYALNKILKKIEIVKNKSINIQSEIESQKILQYEEKIGLKNKSYKEEDFEHNLKGIL